MRSSPVIRIFPFRQVRADEEKKYLLWLMSRPGTPDFPDFSVIQSYLQQYCTKFSLHPHIKLSHTVTNVSRHEDHNQWLIKYVDNSGVAKERFFNKVVVASGQNAKPVYPEGITGFENFKGEILHGQAFKRYE